MIPLLAAIACQDPSDRPPPPPEHTGTTSELRPSWVDAPLPDLVLARSFRVVGSEGRATVTCTAATDPTEVHRAAAGGEDEVTLFGLLAETDYECALAANGWSEDRSFRTGALPDWLPRWTMEVEGPAGGDYTLFNHGTDKVDDRQPKLLIVDPEGRLRWYFRPTLSASDLDASWAGDGVLYGGGYSTPPTVVDLSGSELRKVAASSTGRLFHHHAGPTSSGEVITLAQADNTDGTTSWDGVVVEIYDEALAERTWTWDSQRGVDEGWLPLGTGRIDPYHTNSVQELDGQVYVNFRPISTIARLDRATGELVWRFGRDGDFLLVDDEGLPADPLGWFSKPHAPEHEGNTILMYDNGSDRPGAPLYTRAVEFELDEVARTARVSWEFTEDGWYEGIWGDVDRLSDGNVLITRANCGVCGGGADTTQLVEVDPVTNEVVWRLVMAERDDGGYRAERVDGCAIFANARYCP